MKKIIYQISLILLIIMVGFLSVFITQSNADSIAGLNCPSSVTIGNNLTVSLILPSDAYAAQANITVKWSNGTTSSQMLVYTNGLSENSVSFDTKSAPAGNATVSATNIILTRSNGEEMENGGSKTATVNVISNSPTPSTPSTPSTGNNVTFTDVNETIYTTERCNIRSSYSTSSSIITTVNSGTALKRTGVGSNGWSRINYNGQTAYISSQYVTTTAPSNSSTNETTNNTDDDNEADKEVTFKDVKEVMYAAKNCNLRKSWSSSSERVGYLKAGEQVTRTGIGDNGWSRIDYGGKVMYVATYLLTSEEPEETTDDENEVIEENETNEVEEEEKTELEIIQGEIGVLPEVGENIAVKIYAIVTIIAVIGVVSGVFYIKKSKLM